MSTSTSTETNIKPRRSKIEESEQVEPSVQIYELARQAVERTSDSAAAAAALKEMIYGNAELEEAMLHHAAVSMVASARADFRKGIENDYLAGRDRGIARHAAALRGRMKLFDWKLPETGIPLGEAKVDDLHAAAAYHGKRIKADEARMMMYSAIAKRMVKTPDKKVCEVMKESALAKIMSPLINGASV